MVTTLEDRTRGQLILIGAIAIAFIILGLVVVFNGLLFTQTTSSGDTLESASNAEDVELEINRSVGQIVQKDNNPTEDEIEDEFEETYANLIAQSRPTTVTMDISNLGDKDARLVETSAEVEVYNATDNTNRQLGQLLIRDIEENNADIEIQFDGDGGPNELTIEYHNADDEFIVEWNGDSCRFEIDEEDDSFDYSALSGKPSGYSVTRDCANIASQVRGSYQNIEITENNDNNNVDVVVEGDATDFDPSSPGTSVHWTVEVDYTYDSRATSVEKDGHTIEVYGENL